MGKKLTDFKNLLLDRKIVGLDTSCFIYKFEKHPRFEPLASAIFELLDKNKIKAVTSIITAAEIVTKPYEMGRGDIANLYENVLMELSNFKMQGISYREAKEAAKLKAQYNITLPDAFQIVSSISAGARAFVTNDEKLERVKEIEVILLKNFTR